MNYPTLWGAGSGWSDASNDAVSMTMAQLQELAAAMAQAQVARNDEIYKRQREMKDELDRCDDLSSMKKFAIISD